MRNAGGHALVTNPAPAKLSLAGLSCEEVGAGVFEVDTFTCKHCNCVRHVPVRSQGDEYFCRNCMARICPPCADHPCIPFLKKLERAEARQEALRSYGL
jgi:hypothetical protein